MHSKRPHDKNYAPKIHIILPVHNRLNTTKIFVGCLHNQVYKNFELILVDDGSEDGTAEYVKKSISPATVLSGNGNLWWAGALHKAYHHLRSIHAKNDDIVWIANDDILFDPHYFLKMLSDTDLSRQNLVVSPGKDISSDFIERGFLVDWSSLKTYRLNENHSPDAITTRGLYMLYSTYISIGPMHPRLLPHYLSDLEYTIRAKRIGYNLVNSKSTLIHVDRSSTGIHKDISTTFIDFVFNHLLSKKTAFNSYYWGNFVLLACPWQFKIKNLLRVYYRFFTRLTQFIKKNIGMRAFPK
jgi:GT2 family glycosyltransferase